MLEAEVRALQEERDQLRRDLERTRAELHQVTLAWSEECKERVSAQKAWRESNALFSRWFDGAHIGMICLDGDGVVVQANPAILSLLGASRAGFIGRTLNGWIVEPLRSRIGNALREGTIPEGGPATLQTEGGRHVPVFFSCEAMQPPGRGVCCYFLDASEATASREREERASSLFRQVAENVREVFWISDPERSRYLFVSPASEDVWGLRWESLLKDSRHFWNAIHPDDRNRLENCCRVLNVGEHLDVEYRVFDSTGAIRWIRDRVFAVPGVSDGGKRLAGLAEDVTSAKRAERAKAEAARRQDALAELGKRAASSRSVDDVLNAAVELVGKTLGAPFCKVLEYDPVNEFLAPRAAFGWPREVLKGAQISPVDSQAALTIRTKQAVVVDEWARERRFYPSPLMTEWGVRSGMSALIGRADRPFGVIEVHATAPRRFSADDVQFLVGVAHLLTSVVERHAFERRQETLSVQLIAERQRLSDLLTTIPGVVWELIWIPKKQAFRVGFVSDYVEVVTGLPPHEWIGDEDNWPSRIHPDDRERVMDELRQLILSEEGDAEVQFRWVHRDGRTVWAESRKRIFRDAEGRPAGIRGVLFDVTDRVEACRMRAEAEARFQAFMDNSPVLAFIKDAAGRYVYGNKSFDQMVHRTRRDWHGRTDGELFSPQVADTFSRNDSDVMSGERSEPRQFIEVVEDAMGREQFWTVFKFPLRGSNGELCLGGMAIDITDRRRLEKQILEISDREQRRMGQDLHDGLCQHLLGLAIMSQTLADRLERAHQSEAKSGREISTLLYEAVSLARGLMRGLHLVNLEGGGLCSALEEFCQTSERMFSVSCRFALEGGVEVSDSTLATHIFRIAQEATNNAIKHSAGRMVTITLKEEDGGLVLLVEDDGTGFPPAIDTPGLGLQTMSHRAALIGATLTRGNRAEGGAFVRCVLPPRPEVTFPNA